MSQYCTRLRTWNGRHSDRDAWLEKIPLSLNLCIAGCYFTNRKSRFWPVQSLNDHAYDTWKSRASFCTFCARSHKKAGDSLSPTTSPTTIKSPELRETLWLLFMLPMNLPRRLICMDFKTITLHFYNEYCLSRGKWYMDRRSVNLWRTKNLCYLLR